MSTLAPDATEPRRRLHPLSPLLRGARVIVVIVAALSWQGLAQLGFLQALIVIGGVVAVALVLSWISWLVTGYHLRGPELRVYEGLLWRRTRSIPLERLQAVDVVRPLLARLTGLAELRIEVVGAGKTEAPLAFLTVEEARVLRDRLLSVARQAGAPAARLHPGATDATGTPVNAATSGAGMVSAPVDGAAPAATPAAALQEATEERLHTVPTRDLVLAKLLTPQALLVPFGLVWPLLGFAFHPDLTVVGMAGTLTAVVGIALHPVRRFISEYGFTVGTVPDGLRLRHGLLETTSQTVPPQRVQAVGIIRPLLWRPMGWQRTRMDVAGYGHQQDTQVRADTLLPLAEWDVTRSVVARVLPGLDLTALPLVPPPARAKWRVPLRRLVLAAGLTDTVFVTRAGLIARRLVLVPYARIQSIRIVQGPWQRKLNLANVYVDTAGGQTAVAEHRDVADAHRLVRELADRARAARAGT